MAQPSRVALITGGGTGIGAAAARRFPWLLIGWVGLLVPHAARLLVGPDVGLSLWRKRCRLPMRWAPRRSPSLLI